MNRTRWMLLGMLVLSATIPVGCKTNPATGEENFIAISRQQEIQMGSEAAPEFEKEFDGLVQDEILQQYVAAIGRKLSAVSDRKNIPYEYGLLASEVPNAFALPGGKIYVTAGLMQLMSNERELAAVLGHETAHVAALHNVQGMQRQMGRAILVDLAGQMAEGKTGQYASAVTEVVTAMGNLHYTRKDEYEADKIGLRYMTRAGYNPYGMVELLEALLSAQGQEGSKLEEFFSTHPLTRERIEAVRELIRENHPDARADKPDPARQTFQRMKRRLPKA